MHHFVENGPALPAGVHPGTLWLLTAAVLVAVACSPASTTPVYESPGPYPVGHSTVSVTDSVHMRVLPTEVWYPAAESARAAARTGEPIEDFVVDPTEHATFVGLLPTAASPGTRRQTSSARDVPIASIKGLLPVLAFSHCMNCLRFSSFSIAERLASFGFVVVAPDHVNDTLFDELAGTSVSLSADFLETRRQDISAVLDAVLDPAGTTLPAALRGRLDASRVGMFGHSYGAATVGLALKEEPRILAGFALATPLANPLFPMVTIADIKRPFFMLEMQEDNSIGTIGNYVIEQNFADATGPGWLAEVADAEHWSVSDICGLTSLFPAGCTMPAIRQTDNEPFTPLDINEARGIAAAYVTAFFMLELQHDSTATKYLDGNHPQNVVTSHVKN